MQTNYWEGRKTERNLIIVAMFMGAALFLGFLAVIATAVTANQSSQPGITVSGEKGDGANVSSGQANIETSLTGDAIDLPQINGNYSWWAQVATNQLNRSVVEATMQTFQKYGISTRGNAVYGTCGENAIAMDMNYLDKVYGRNPVQVEDVIRMSGNKGLIYSDGSLSMEKESEIATNYGFKVYGRDAHLIGQTGYALTENDVIKFTKLGYPVSVAVRVTDKGLNPDRQADVTHSILVIGVDDSANMVTIISSQLDLHTTADSAIRPQQVPLKLFLSSWLLSDNAGLGFVIYR